MTRRPTSINAARLKRARRRMLGYFLGSGVVLAFLYILAAALVVRLIGIEVTRFWSTIAMAAGVMLGGTYGFIMFIALGIHICRRLIQSRPIVDRDD
jgi:hypothetical protein